MIYDKVIIENISCSCAICKKEENIALQASRAHHDLKEQIDKLEKDKIGWNDKIPDDAAEGIERMAPGFRPCADCGTTTNVSFHSSKYGRKNEPDKKDVTAE